jgi:WD40 repeat protein
MATLKGHGAPVYRVSFSPDGKMLASGSSDKSIKVWDVTTGQCVATLTGHTGAVSGVCWSPDGATLAGGSRDNSIKLWVIKPSNQ